jgi:hypothetical protein
MLIYVVHKRHLVRFAVGSASYAIGIRVNAQSSGTPRAFCGQGQQAERAKVSLPYVTSITSKRDMRKLASHNCT